MILILLYCPLWGGILPYPQKDKWYLGTFGNWVHNLFVLNLFGAAFCLSSKQKVANCRHLKIDNITPCQMFSLYRFLFYSIVLSEVAFRLILRRTNNIWVHLETKSTTYLFSIYLEWHSALAPNRKYPIADTWKLIILTPSQFLFTIPILILLYCPLWGGIPPYYQKDK